MSKIMLTNITKIYGEPKKKGLLPEGTRAVDDISLEIPDKSFTVLVGPSGCGKTTLLRMIAGLETITLGNITIGDVDVTHLEPGDRGIAMVFQTYALYPHLTVWKNIEFGLKNARIPDYEINKRIKNVLKLVNLEQYANRRPANLSGGQRQRVALARAISKEPEVFLMDEPLSNLDAKLRSTMRTEIIQMHKNLNTTFVYVTHDQIEAMTMGDHIVVMNEGLVIQTGTPTEIHDEPNCVFVAKFIGDPGMNIIKLGSNKHIGFRPRNIQFLSDDLVVGKDDVVIEARIVAVENHGSEKLYFINFGKDHIYIKDAEKEMKEMGSVAKILIRKRDIYAFDENEARIYDEAEVNNIYDEFRIMEVKL
ncbi:ABC transporter ATP-binding protein [Acholeplasma granularum]|uniref:ABC transporter ATP-binding protein n=1 Tax=Acholeplasma granularum TaxID=264635 RepID=UPI0004708200|nr:ABC transporter ATP-binding protein [Acholeplasma granularum]